MPLYKYVDVVDASYLEAGSIKFGTLRGYAHLESSRADPFENSKIPVISYANWDNPAHRAGMSMFGRFSGDGLRDISMFGMRGRPIFGKNRHCLCVSYRGDLPDRDGPQAVFQIDDVKGWLKRLAKVIPIGPFTYGLVKYGERSFEATAAVHPQVDPFLKSVFFEDEYEVRILAIAEIRDDRAAKIGRPDVKLARFMRRIR